MSKTRYHLTQDRAGPWIFPRVQRLEFTASRRFGDYIAQTGLCTSDIDAPCFYATEEQAEAARLEVLHAAIGKKEG